MECEIVVYGLINPFINIRRGSRDTRSYLHAPGNFFIGLIEHIIGDSYLSLKRNFVYVKGSNINGYREELGKKFKFFVKPGKFEISDKDIEEIKNSNGEINDLKKRIYFNK